MAAYKAAIEDGLVGKDESVVLFNTATGLKYPLPEVNSLIDRFGEIDYTMFS